MRHGLFESFLARDAFPDDAGDFLEAVDDPHPLSGRVEDMFGAGVELVIMNEPDVSSDVFVFAREDDGEFCLVFDV